MPVTKAKELRELPLEELEEKIILMKNNLAKEKTQISSGTRAENPGKIKKIRREISRTLTVINEKKKLKELKKNQKPKEEKKGGKEKK